MEIQVEEIKEFLDACHKAKRIAEMMPELPEGMTPRHVHVIDAIYQLERTGEMVKVSDVSEYLEVTRPRSGNWRLWGRFQRSRTRRISGLCGWS